MTAAWTEFLTTGEGPTSWRAVIEGCPYEFVTDASMEKTTSDNRIRTATLKRKSIGFEIHADLPTGKLEARFNALEIMNDQENEYTLKAFSWKPTYVTWLNADLTAVATTVTVFSTDGMANGDVIHIGTEAILIGTVASSTSLTGCTRAYWNTTAQAHYTGNGAERSYPEVTLARPACLGGRRVFIYGYAQGDTMSGDGTLFLTAMVSMEPSEMSPTHWSVPLDTLLRLTETDLGSDTKQMVGSRGAYYSAAAPLVIGAWLHTGDSLFSTRDASFETWVVWSGFAEEQESFIGSLNTALNTAFTGWASKLRARSFGADGWGLEVTTDGTAKWLEVWVASPVDGWAVRITESLVLDAASGVPVRVVTASESYPLDFTGGPVPRAYIGYGRYEDAVNADTYPPDRIYMDGTVVPDAFTTAASIQYPADSLGNPSNDHVGQVVETNATDRWIRVLLPAEPHQYGRDNPIKIKLGFEYAVGNVADLIGAIITNSPTYTNTGQMPFLTSGDINFAEIESEVDAGARDYAFANRRRYITFGEQKFRELLEHDGRMSGGMFIIDAVQAGLITFRRPKFAAPTDAIVLTYDSTTTVKGAPKWRRNPRGAIHTVVVKTGWNASEGKHLGTTYFVRDVTAVGRHKVPAAPLEIAPKSEYAELREEARYMTAEDARGLGQPLLGMFGAPYALVDLPAPLSFLRARLLTNVAVTSARVPNEETGTRGITGKMGLLVGVKFTAADPNAGVLTVMLHGQELRGYSPSARVVDQTDQGSNKWVLEIDTTVFKGADGTTTSENYFAVGDKVRIVKRDMETATTVTGTVTDVDTAADTIAVQFDGVWTPGTDKWHLMYGKGSAVAAGANAAAQQRYCMVASSAGRVINPNRNAATFAPS